MRLGMLTFVKVNLTIELKNKSLPMLKAYKTKQNLQINPKGKWLDQRKCVTTNHSTNQAEVLTKTRPC